MQIVKFASKGGQDSFYDTVKAKVNEYFSHADIPKHGNITMYVKTVVMLSMYFVPYFLIVTGVAAAHMWLFYGLWMLMGVGVAGIGTSVMHDSNHDSYSTNPFVNNMLGGVLNLLGGYSRNWKIQHNILHHTYTNLDGLDEDLEAGILLRMSPHKKRYSIHRYQHIYAWLLYGIMNIYWVTAKDYKNIIGYHKNGMLKKQKITLRRALTELSLYKVLYFTYVLVLPILFADVAWYHVVWGFVIMHLIGGLMLACIFQLAHVMETSEFPMPTDENKMMNSWAIHQLLNTANFSPKSRIMSWFIGGLNYQIEHHLFPHICHVHYPKLSVIVKQTAQEYNLPYNVQPNFVKALIEHGTMLKRLGRS